MTDNIKQFPGADGLPDNPLAIQQQTPSYCSHDAVILNEHLRTIECRACGQILDPFNFVRNQAQVIARAWQAHKSAMVSVNEVTERVAALKKQEANLRAIVKRLQDKTGSVLVVRDRNL